jgi:predicted RNase H-like nuclease
MDRGGRARVVGVDGCRAGWVGIVLGPGRRIAGVFGATIGDLVAAAGPVDAIGIDMPIHPPSAGLRAADLAARAHLGRKASSVFLTPARAVLEAPTYAAACATARAFDGRGISQQAWALRHKILELEAWLAAAPCAVHEVHPEVSFSLLAGAPILARKTSWAGHSARRSALAGGGIVVPDDVGTAGAVAGADDVLDAAAVAWSARRLAAGEARSFPAPPERLADGRVAAIWA